MSVWADIARTFGDVVDNPMFGTALDIACGAAGGPAAVAACRIARESASRGLDYASGDAQAERRRQRAAERLAREQAWLEEGAALRDRGTGLTAGRTPPSQTIVSAVDMGAWTMYQTGIGEWLAAPRGLDLVSAITLNLVYEWTGSTWTK